MYTVYKITNSFNLKYYIGVHKTSIPNDNYFGSGLIIKRMILKHGKKNFNKKILHTFKIKEDAFKKEKELINLTDVNCLNISIGGQGGALFTNRKHSNKTKQHLKQKSTEQFKDGMPQETKDKLRKVATGKNNGMWKEKIKFICPSCNTIKYLLPCRAKYVKYCSRKCRYSGGWSNGISAVS